MPLPGPGPGPSPSEFAAEESLYRSARPTPSRSVSPEADLSAEPSSQPTPPPKYRISRTVKTVQELWREWTVSLRGGPSITALDNRWGTRWRAGRQAELQWYSLRLEVIREIRRIAQARRISEEAAMHFVSAEQRQTNCSLDLFCKRLRANRRTREAAAPGK